MEELDTARIVAETAELVTAHYVFTDIAAQLADLLLRRSAEGRYAVATAEELGALVTEDLQSVNGDRHLRLLFHEEEVPKEVGGAALASMAREAARSLNGVPLVQLLDDRVALLELAPILFPLEMTAETLRAALNLVAPAEALVIDLRRTRGGSPDTVALVCSYLLDEPTHLNTMYWRAGDNHEQSWSQAYVPGPRFGGTKPVYVLTSATTFSGGEELTYDLQQLGRAVVIGERTGGGAHPRKGYTVHPHLEATVPTGRAINPVSGTNWEGTGIVPDIEVPADQALSRALGEARTALDGAPAA